MQENSFSNPSLSNKGGEFIMTEQSRGFEDVDTTFSPVLHPERADPMTLRTVDADLEDFRRRLAKSAPPSVVFEPEATPVVQNNP